LPFNINTYGGLIKTQLNFDNPQKPYAFLGDVCSLNGEYCS